MEGASSIPSYEKIWVGNEGNMNKPYFRNLQNSILEDLHSLDAFLAKYLCFCFRRCTKCLQTSIYHHFEIQETKSQRKCVTRKNLLLANT